MFKGFFKSTWFCILLLIILAIPLCQGLMGPLLISAHDSMAGYVRALSMSRYMGHGQLLVRWAPEINWGYGYPVFNFYPPFFSFVSVIFFQLTHHMALAVNLALIMFWVLSAIGMFLFARESWGDEGGMLSAVLYLYAPYHIVDIYVRGAFAEFSSFAILPYLLLAILKTSRKPSLGYMLLGIASVFVLSLTHNIMSMLFFPVAVAYIIYLFFTGNRSGWIFPAGGIIVIGLMVSSFFWVPALLEKKFLSLGFLVSMRYDFHKSFITLGNLFWPWNNGAMDSVTFHTGVINTFLCLGSLAYLPKIFKINRQTGLGYVFFLIVGVLAVFFSLPGSHFFWEHIHLLSYIQFPWRFLTIIAFAMSFLGGSAGLLIKDHLLKRIALGFIGILVMVFSLKSFPDISYIYQLRTVDNFVALGEGEYTPKWVMIPPDKRPDSKFEIVQGRGQIGEVKALDPVHYETTLSTLVPSVVCFHTFYFPGWQVLVDHQSINPYIKNPFGLILFHVPQGEHDIQVVFGPTPARIAGVLISWAGVLLLIGIVLWVKFGLTKPQCLTSIILCLCMIGFVPTGFSQTDDLSKYISYLKSPDPDKRMSGAEELGAIKDLSAVEPLIALLRDLDKSVRRSAARSLGFIGDPEAVPGLIALLSDPDPTVRRTAVNALGNIKDNRAVEPLIALLKDENPDVREDTVIALGKIHDIRSYDPLHATTKDPNINVKKAAQEALGEAVKEPADSANAATAK